MNQFRGGTGRRSMDISSKSSGEEEKHTSVVQIEDHDLISEISLGGNAMNAWPPVSQSCCIYRVPRNLYRLNEKDYTPRIVSIGPFHRGKRELQAMEEQKLRYLQSFLDLTKLSLKDCMTVVTGWEERARSCYSETIDLTSDEFRMMILLDSCFLLMTIWKGNVSEHVTRDMILLENQLPFFVLDGLHKLVFASTSSKETFLELSVVYFTKMMLPDKVRNIVNVVSGCEVKHFVDLLRLCHLPSTPRSVPVNQVTGARISCATELVQAGITFWSGSREYLLDIRYNTSGVLEIPKISLERTSECLLRNLIVLERLHYTYATYITDYVFFMDKLINSSKDVDILVQNDIILSWMGDSSDVAALFNNLGAEISSWWPAYYYAKISEDLNSYCSVPRRWWRKGLIRDNCSTPLMMAFTIIAIILLVYTYAQTIYSIITYGF